MLTPIIFIIVLSVLVLIHELGHFIAAKKIGVKVEEFGLGYPPRFFGKKIGDTIYSLNLLPFGGFVKLFGENGEEEVEPKKKAKTKSIDKEAFYNRSKIERSIILVAGVFMNFVLGIVVTTIIFTNGVVSPSEKVFIEQVQKGSPAEVAGLKAGDQILSINGQNVKTPTDVIAKTKSLMGVKSFIDVKRCDLERIENVPTGKETNCKNLQLNITPKVVASAKEGPMGVAISNLIVKKYSWWQAPIYGTQEAFRLSYMILEGIGRIFYQLFFRANIPSDVAGPIGIYQITGEAVKFGPLAVLQLVAILSLNLAVVNILPIPALDGGRLALIFVESFVGRKKLAKYENIASSIGFATLIGLIVLITFNDLNRIFGIIGVIKNFLHL